MRAYSCTDELSTIAVPAEYLEPDRKSFALQDPAQIYTSSTYQPILSTIVVDVIERQKFYRLLLTATANWHPSLTVVPKYFQSKSSVVAFRILAMV
jgi:hypothetical protein